MKKRVVALTLAGVLALGMTACGEDAPGGYDSNDRGEEGIIPDASAYVKQIDVNGNTCVIFRDGPMGGITCNWEVDSTN